MSHLASAEKCCLRASLYGGAAPCEKLSVHLHTKTYEPRRGLHCFSLLEAVSGSLPVFLRFPSGRSSDECEGKDFKSLPGEVPPDQCGRNLLANHYVLGYEFVEITTIAELIDHRVSCVSIVGVPKHPRCNSLG